MIYTIHGFTAGAFTLSIDCCAGTLKLDRSLAQSCCATSRAELHPSTSSHFPLSPCAFDVLVNNCLAEVLGKTQPSASGRRTRSVCASRSSRNKLTKMTKQGSNMDKKDVNTDVKNHSFPMHGDLLYDIICIHINSHSHFYNISIHNINLSWESQCHEPTIWGWFVNHQHAAPSCWSSATWTAKLLAPLP